MSKETAPRKKLTRRNFLALGGGALAAAAGVRLLPETAVAAGVRNSIALAPAAASPVHTIDLVATDGWISLPAPTMATSLKAPIYPDPLAPAGRTTYIFGFRNVTGVSAANAQAQKNKAQASAPMLYIKQEEDVNIKLTNLGLTQRPDLTDSHTVHFHGFRDAIPLFDGVPEMSIAVPIGRDFTYFYRAHAPGTYMYHCHFEDVEHVQMGMTGIIVVTPTMNTSTTKYAYNDASTQYDREFGMFLSELWAEAHYNDAHIQATDWSDFKPDFWLLNGRSYPDTLAPNGSTDLSTGDMIAPAGRPDLQYQPISSLVQANAGDKVLLRFVNLGYQQEAMTLGGIPMRVVGKDATLLKGRGTAYTAYDTSTIYIGPGESYDAIFTAPPKTGPGAYDTYLLYNRKFASLNNGGDAALGGQVTEVRIYPANTLGTQMAPNT